MRTIPCPCSVPPLLARPPAAEQESVFFHIFHAAVKRFCVYIMQATRKEKTGEQKAGSKHEHNETSKQGSAKTLAITSTMTKETRGKVVKRSKVSVYGQRRNVKGSRMKTDKQLTHPEQDRRPGWKSNLPRRRRRPLTAAMPRHTPCFRDQTLLVVAARIP